ncbi:MAG: glycosyltransferase [Bacillota bacterium]
MKVLGFCFFPAFVPPSNGGQSRLFNFYRALSKWHEVTLLTSTHINVEEEVIHHGIGFIERRVPKDDYFVQQYDLLNRYSSGGDLSGPAIAACGQFPTRLHQAYLEEYDNADVIIHDSPFTIEYDLFAGIDGKARIYNAYNCETQLYRQLHPDEKSRPIHEIVRLAELRMLEQADLVLYCNEEDLAVFREMALNARFNALFAPNGLMPRRVSKKDAGKESGSFTVVFMGSNHPPNVHAAKFIVHTLAPQLPEVTFAIIGSCLQDGSYPPNVRRYGVVNDELKEQLLSHADLALNPVVEGSGSNVKVLDYFSYKLPVLSSPFGMRGIQAEAGTEYLEATLDQFVDVIRSVMNKPQYLAEIAAAGQALAHRRYTWDTTLSQVADAIIKLSYNKSLSFNRFVLALNDYDSFERIGGGGARTRGLYMAVREWSPVVFVSFSDDGRLRVRKYDEGITVINVPKTPDHLSELQYVNAQFHVSADDIVASRHCLANPYLKAIYRVLRQFARCIVVEHCYMASLPGAWGDRFVYSSHNNETELKKQLLEQHPLKAELLRDVDRIERYAVEQAAATIAVCREDAESLVRGKRMAGPVIVVRNGAAIPVSGEDVNKTASTLNEKILKRSVVFLGSAHMPNVDAAKFIVERLAPACPDVQFHLLGSVCRAVPPTVPKNVQLWGEVDETTKSAVMQSCALAINPIFSGSGSNVKLADYLGNGLFVVTTEFGQRGYPRSIREHVEVVPLERFPEAIQRLLDYPEMLSKKARLARQQLFMRELSMQSIAKRFVDTLKMLEEKRSRVLFVTYRYTHPLLGGAEIYVEKLIRALGNSGKFDVDVIAPEISGIQNHWRFSERYSFDLECSAPIDIPNVRFARFPVDVPDPGVIDKCIRNAWKVQPRFEKAISQRLLSHYTNSGLAWGWAFPHVEAGNVSRWALAECGIFVIEEAKVELSGYVPVEVVITALCSGSVVAGPWTVKGRFQLEIPSVVGEIELVTSAPIHKTDPRPLGFLLTHMTVAGQVVDLALPPMFQQYLSRLPAETAIQILDQAATETRTASDVRLTDGRGPWSSRLERFIANHVAEYDLVVTHNNVFRPAVIAINEAKKHGVPSILIPHAHLDDDFYHFPDLLESARNASLVLAAPRMACEFFASKGCNVRYLPAGCDTTEDFTQDDVEAFRAVYQFNSPFILVLGRKSGAKGYRQTIDAVEQLNREGIDVRVVLIGPDDDGVPVDSPCAVYLGRQPRNVVRGALKSCIALCNMSVSESFGIVLLEAWLAGKPVIANKACAAFNDIAVDNENALLVTEQTLPYAIRQLISDQRLRERLARNGHTAAMRFDWSVVSEQFVQICSSMVTERRL